MTIRFRPQWYTVACDASVHLLWGSQWGPPRPLTRVPQRRLKGRGAACTGMCIEKHPAQGHETPGQVSPRQGHRPLEEARTLPQDAGGSGNGLAPSFSPLAMRGAPSVCLRPNKPLSPR